VFQKIDHIGIVVSDLSESLVWYADTLGWIVHHEEYIPHAGAKIAHLLPEPNDLLASVPSLQLVQPIEPSPVLDHLRSKGEGLHHICFEVDDMSRALSSLGTDSDSIFLGGQGRLACFLEGSPDGVLIELMEAASSPRKGPR